ncbi:DUF512 domain-containing protein [Alkalibacter mobilis]|uniref:DUF512 domain-containing protein n=1 Tax=Alkalibacter mobilis TaxID=2787712 RepID=UPI00189E4D1C|nr:DUF512 domain-containing protein [Alkalibacter mobilis]
MNEKKTKKIVISEVEVNSIAEELDIEPGDVLVSINNKIPKDIFDYYYLLNDNEIVVEIEKMSGEIWELEIEKELDESLGLSFEQGLLDEPKSCNNKCIFCFIDQLPRGMRHTLYFKDDDTRLSFMHGNYVTLTNLKEEEIQRIIDYRIQPINISIHTTDPELRRQMLNNKNAGKINDLIQRFADKNMHMNGQIVLCPEINDGDNLIKTLNDLSGHYPYMETVSVVPVGITKFREKLSHLRSFTKEECRKTLKIIRDVQDNMLSKHNTRFVFPSDEFFLKAEIEIPEKEYYEGFNQLENGVGMMSFFINDCKEAIAKATSPSSPKEISLATGVLAYEDILDISELIMLKYPDIKIKVHRIINEFFGEKITVTGLITGRDLIDQLKSSSHYNQIFIPSNMLKHDEPVFLDDLSLDDVRKELKANVTPQDLDGFSFIKNILESNI